MEIEDVYKSNELYQVDLTFNHFPSIKSWLDRVTVRNCMLTTTNSCIPSHYRIIEGRLYAEPEDANVIFSSRFSIRFADEDRNRIHIEDCFTERMEEVENYSLFSSKVFHIKFKGSDFFILEEPCLKNEIPIVLKEEKKRRKKRTRVDIIKKILERKYKDEISPLQKRNPKRART